MTSTPIHENGTSLDSFLAERDFSRTLSEWLGDRMRPGDDRIRLVQRITNDIAIIDELLNDQVNEIIHHPAFQKLEASWRGVRYLVDQSDGHENIKIRLIHFTWEELVRDLDRALEFDQSQLFKKVYNEEFGMPGGEPYGLLLGDYEVTHRVTASHPTDDITALRRISQVAAAAFAPFIAAAGPTFFGVDTFEELQRPINLARVFDSLEYLKWRKFRESEDSRFVGLTLPRTLMRLPYLRKERAIHHFQFREDVEGPTRSKYLWGNGVYAFAAVVLRAFSETNWLAEIRGVDRTRIWGGLVTGLPAHDFGTDEAGVAMKCSTELIITDAREKDYIEQGFLPISHCRGTPYSAFYGSNSVQKPKKYDREAATINARVSAILQYMLCVARFAHYLKVICRDKVGKFTEADELERYLHSWIHKYVTADPSATNASKAVYPLREAAIRLRETPGKPGTFQCVAHLRPHFQLEQLVASLKLQTELTGLG